MWLLNLNIKTRHVMPISNPSIVSKGRKIKGLKQAWAT